MRIRNNFRFAEQGKVLINLESLTTSTILPLDKKWKEVNQEEVEWELLRLKYKLEEEENYDN